VADLVDDRPLDLFGVEVASTTKWTALFSSDTDEWPTDAAVVEWWARRRGRPFTLDVAATAGNAKAPRFYTALDNALIQRWHDDAGDGDAWCNPPYSDIDRFVAKAFRERAFGLATVLLLPSRTDRPWFHQCLRELALGNAEIYFAAGRLRFGDAKADAPFPSVVVVTVPR
jgi:phage N-6-adenine-methyltransferase